MAEGGEEAGAERGAEDYEPGNRDQEVHQVDEQALVKEGGPDQGYVREQGDGDLAPGEVRELHLADPRQQHVGRVEIPVHQPERLAVGAEKDLGELEAPVKEAPPGRNPPTTSQV